MRKLYLIYPFLSRFFSFFFVKIKGIPCVPIYYRQILQGRSRIFVRVLTTGFSSIKRRLTNPNKVLSIINGGYQSINGSMDNICVNACAPRHCSVRLADSHIGDRTGIDRSAVLCQGTSCDQSGW